MAILFVSNAKFVREEYVHYRRERCWRSLSVWEQLASTALLARLGVGAIYILPGFG